MTNRDQTVRLPAVDANIDAQLTSSSLPSIVITDPTTGPPPSVSTNPPTILVEEAFNRELRAYQSTPYSQITESLNSLRSSLRSTGNITGIPIAHRNLDISKNNHQIYKLSLRSPRRDYC